MLFLSRDRFGEKPLFFYRNDKSIYFGSEIRFIKSLSEFKFSINVDQILRNLKHGYKSLWKNSDTYYNKIEYLKQGESLLLINNKIKKEKEIIIELK